MRKKVEMMEEMKEDLLKAKDSPFFAYRQDNNYLPVIGKGNLNSKLMFIGEAPGKNEAEKGKPFCGRSGQILDELLDSLNLKREDIYITNIVKDRPPANRDPKPEEIDFYAPLLWRQIEIISPLVLITLGRFSSKYVLEFFNCHESDETIGALHGRVISVSHFGREFFVVPLFHPAATIYNQSLKETLRADFKVLKKFI